MNIEKNYRDRFFTLKPRRKFRNRILKPSLQLGLPIFSLLLTLLFVAMVVLTVRFAFSDIYGYIMSQANIDPEFKDLIYGQIKALIGILSALAVSYAILMFVVSVTVTQRIIGPHVAFLRQIQALKGGDYSARLALRKKDAFTDVATELNELAEILDAKFQNTSSGDH